MSTQSHKGQVLPLKNRVIPVDNNTAFLAHYDISENDVLSGIAPTGTPVFTLRSDGYYGGGIAVEESTNNLFPQPTSSAGFSLKGGGTIDPVEYSNTKVVYRYEYAQRVTWSYHGIAISVTAGLQYTLSFDAYISVDTDATGSPMVVGWEGADGTYFYYDTTKKGQWVTFQRTVTSTGGTVNIYIYPTTTDLVATKGYLLIRNMQFEQKGFSTSFINGSRPISNLRYPSSIISGLNQGTVAFWYKPTNVTSGGYEVIMRCGEWGAAANGWGIVKQSGATYPYFEVGIPGTATSTALASSAGLTSNIWHYLVATWGPIEVCLYVFNQTGLIQRAVAAGLNQILNYQAPICLGKHTTDDTLQTNGIFDELRIDKVARTQDEILAWYYSNSPFWPKGIYKAGY